ncbi:MAG: response regulator [Candidatus Promineifilaceae bacterium]
MSEQIPPKQQLKQSLILRYLILAGAFLTVSLLLYGVFQVYTTYREQSADLQNKVEIQTSFLAAVSINPIVEGDFSGLERLMRETSADPDVVYSIITHTDGRVLTRFVDREDPLIAEVYAAQGENPSLNTIELFELTSLHSLVREHREAIDLDGELIGEVRLGYSVASVRQRVFNAGLIILLATLALTATLLTLTYVLFNWLIGHPLQEVGQLAQMLANGELDTRAELTTPDEIGRLKLVFNQMAAQLQSTLEGAQESRKAAEAANVALRIREAEARQLSHVASRTSNMVVITDAKGYIEWVNDAFIRLTEYSLDEVIGKRPGSLLQGPDSDSDSVRYMREQLKAQQGFSSELINYSKSGKPYWVDIDVQPVHDEQGVLTNFIAVENDISERKSAEVNLRNAKDAALAADKAKSDFLANMSHEIRTPLNGIIGMTSLLMESDLSRPQRENLDIIRSSGDSLLVIINDILDFSKIEADQLDLEAVPFNLRACVEDALALLSTQAGKKKLDLAYDLASHLPTMVVGDITRVRQVLVNLISNAIKFTEEGEVAVFVKGHFVEDSRLQLEFAVRDTGIGIRKEDAQRLFQAFSQVDASTTRHYGGTGLGLAISKRLSELMGGSIWVDSEVGRGSTFNFNIVVGVAEQQPEEPDWSKSATALRHKHILVVDDNRTNRHLLSRYLENWGAQVTVAESGTAALTYIANSNHPLDAAILDVHMPLMDGYSLAKLLRQQLPKLPLIIFSSSGRGAPKKTGVDIYAYLAKPLKPAALFQILQGLFSKVSSTKPAVQASTAPKHDKEMGSKYPLSILVAEDNRINQLVMTRLLNRVGYRADMVANGLEAVEAVDRQHYDLIFMDIQMPEMDGVQATRYLKENIARGECPYIIALTANALDGDRERYLAVGMDAYISKPISINELVAALQETVTHKAAALSNRWATWIDMEQFEQQFGDSAADALQDLIPLFIEDTGNQLKTLRTAIEASDFEQTKRVAHTLRGSSGNMGLTQLSKLLTQIEHGTTDRDSAMLLAQLEAAEHLFQQFVGKY